MKNLLLISLLLVSQLCFAEFRVLELNEAKLGYRSYFFARDPMFLDSMPKEQLNFGFESILMEYGYWKGLVHGTTDPSQYKRIGLQMEFGIRILHELEFSYIHHSQHMLDSIYPHQRFPCEDSWGIYLYLFRKPNKNNTLF